MDRSAVEAVKARINIADIVRRYVDLKPVSGRWMGACPFHQETKPSMSVNEEEGFFYCFGCQASGDVIDFYQRINGLEFVEALEALALEAGIDIQHTAPDPQAAQKRQQKKLLLDMHDESRDFFCNCLGHAVGETARQYLERRGMTQEIIQAFQLGYSPDDWHGLDNFLRSKGRNPEDGVEAGLLSKNQKGNIYDRFRGRLIFPIKNLSGRVIAFGGRIITDGEPKYLNSSDSPIYKKGEHLYGLDIARQSMTRTRRALLTEGYMDVLSLHQFGYTDACGVLGTALTKDQVKRLAGFCSRVDLVFDGDNAGRKAALKSSRMILLHGVACRVVLLPDGEDVDSLLQAKGRDGFDQCLEQASNGLDFCASYLQSQFSPREIMDWARNFLSELSDDSLRAYYLPRLAQGLGLAETEMRMTAGAPSRTPQTHQPKVDARSIQPGQMPLGKEDKDDRYFLKFPIQYPEYIPSLAQQGFEHVLSTDWARALWSKLYEDQPRVNMTRLNENEKGFFIQCREDLCHKTLTGEKIKQEWEHICTRIEKNKCKLTKTRIKQALHQAQQTGDMQRANECLQALEEYIRRENEQH
ncbi:DNA primase [Pseudodesulfovibrio senegalensis]|uniref:DNA primase n=1 Tax=Pseudodesulfovibrio senegalensis TaxID=1721087 RepID=A0A6N6N7Z8_9BACT|nr:DNA primase [Pseudodesulfovibrio senegalensis]KAB1443781.1 DNA primase [Pseudodesulfovibrio senegalensis]